MAAAVMHLKAGSLRTAQGAPSTLDAKTRTARIVAVTSGPIPMRYCDFPYDLYLDFAGLRLRRPTVPLLDNHRAGSVQDILGSVSDFQRAGNQLLATVCFAETPEGQRAYDLAEQGHLDGISVGFTINEAKFVKDGETATFNGAEVSGPANICLDFEIFETSVCPMGADNNARLLHHNPQEDIVTDSLATPQGGAENPAATPASNPAIDQARLAALRDREDVDRACRNLGLDMAEGARLLAAGMDARSAKMQLLEVAARLNPPVAPFTMVEGGRTDAQKFAAAAADSILLRSSLGGFSASKPAAPGAENLRGLMLRELARDCVVRAGHQVPGDVRAMVGLALTSSDLPNILGAVVNKSLAEGTAEADERFMEFCSVGSAPDFKPTTIANLGAFNGLDQVPEDAEYKYASLADGAEKVTLATYGKLVQISRQAIINDDLNALTELPMAMGRAAWRTVGDLSWGVLTGNQTMADGYGVFDATHHANVDVENLPPSNYAFGKAETAMALQKDVAGVALGITPVFVLGPMALKSHLESILALQTYWSSSTDGVGPYAVQGSNVWAGRLKPICDRRLDAVSATAWYVLARRNTVRLFFLNGNTAPYLEQRQGWTRDGTEFKVRIDAAAKALDWRTMYKNTGAALLAPSL